MDKAVWERLPRVYVPLTIGSEPKEIAGVSLDLQEVINHGYLNSGISRSLDYDLPCIPRLHNEDAAWADALLREKGLRL